MKITIQEIDESHVQFVKQYGSSFQVTSKLALQAENGKISYTIVEVPSYTKQYDPDVFEPHLYVGSSDKTIFFAYVDNKLAGQIRLEKYWNAYAYIADIAVEPNYRGQGVGHTLMERAIEWAKSKGFPGMMLETQNNNVAACRLYERCGFELGGFDVYLYKGLEPATDEVALYWYLIF
jgi:ribosomal protein S18 acetylase RimI-like enzyme